MSIANHIPGVLTILFYLLSKLVYINNVNNISSFYKIKIKRYFSIPSLIVIVILLLLSFYLFSFIKKAEVNYKFEKENISSLEDQISILRGEKNQLLNPTLLLIDFYTAIAA